MVKKNKDIEQVIQDTPWTSLEEVLQRLERVEDSVHRIEENFRKRL